jgi:hypothetical protein
MKYGHKKNAEAESRTVLLIGRMKMRSLASGALVCVMAAAALAGCSRKLETGYTPNKLSDTPAARRAYYAQPFTPEAAAANDRETELQQRRPRPGY